MSPLLTLSLTLVLYFSTGDDSSAYESVKMSTIRNEHFGSIFPVKQTLSTGTSRFEQ